MKSNTEFAILFLINIRLYNTFSRIIRQRSRSSTLVLELRLLWSLWTICSNNHAGSGVTRVGVTRGGNWRCHPYFSRKKLATFFSYHPFYLPSPIFPRRFSSVLCKFSHIFFHSGVTPLDGVTRGDPPPPPALPSDATTRRRYPVRYVHVLQDFNREHLPLSALEE